MPTQKDLKEWLLKELYFCYLEARKNKRHTRDEHLFELNDFENLTRLRDDIIQKRYKPSRGVAFITYKPVVREIFAAPFRDRVVHHFLFNQVSPWWDRRFIYDSYSCRKDKGTLMGIKRMQHHMRQVSQQGTRETYVIKLDIQGYFMSLPRKRVYERVCWGIEQQYGADLAWLADIVRYLWKEVIFDNPIDGVRIRGSFNEWQNLPESKSLFCQPPGRGVVIGNLSSQLISNIYLDQLDRFIKFELGYKHYGRYVDDFYLVVPAEDLERALQDIEKIDEFLYSIELTLHPKKRYIQNIRRGVPFLGTIIYLNNIVPDRRFLGNFYQSLLDYSAGRSSDESVVSYLGYLSNYDGKNIAKKYFDKVGFDYYF